MGQIGRLNEQKSPDVFVEMAEKIKKEIPNSFFVMVGDGNLEAEIRRLIKMKGLEDSFLITGWVDNPDRLSKLFRCSNASVEMGRLRFGLSRIYVLWCAIGFNQG